MDLLLFLSCFFGVALALGAFIALIMRWATNGPRLGRTEVEQPKTEPTVIEDSPTETLKRVMVVIDDWISGLDPEEEERRTRRRDSSRKK